MTENYTDTIHIVCAADRAFLRHVPAMLRSVRANTTRPLRASIISTTWSKRDQQKLVDAIDGIELEFLTISSSLLTGLTYKMMLSPLTYARLFMPDLVTAGRFLYLDIDMIVRKDVAQLWDTDLSGAPAAAVFHDNGTSLNAGLMLVDANAWRSRALGKTILEWSRKHQPKEADQAATEAVIGAEMLRLDTSWNSIVDPIWGKPLLTDAYLQSASVLHYIKGFKPWNLGRWVLPAAYVKEWDRYATRTGLPIDWKAEFQTVLWQAGILARRATGR